MHVSVGTRRDEVKERGLCSPVAHGGGRSAVCLERVARREGEEQMCLFFFMQPH